jgi:hypothetical protein
MIIYVHCCTNLFGYDVLSLAFQHSCECTVEQSSTEETKFVPAFWFRSVSNDKLDHATRTTTMKIILQLRIVSVVKYVPAQRHFVDSTQFHSLYVPETDTKFKLEIVRHYYGTLTIPSCSHQLIQHCSNLIVGGHFHKFLDNFTNNTTVHVLQPHKLSNPTKRSCVRMRKRANRARHVGTVRPVCTRKWTTEHRRFSKR